MVPVKYIGSGGDGGRSCGVCSVATFASSVECSLHDPAIVAIEKLRVAPCNVGTTRKIDAEDQSSDLKEDRLRLTTWEKMGAGFRKTQNKMLTNKDSHYKFFWTGRKKGKGGVVILQTESWVANVFDVVCISASSSWN